MNFTELAIPVEDCVEALELVLLGEVEKVGVIIGGVTSLVVGLGEGDGVVGEGLGEGDGDGDGVFGLGDGDGVVGGGLGKGEGMAGGVYVDVWTAEFEGPGLPIDVTIVPIPVPLETSKVQTPSGQHSHGAWLPRVS